MRGAYNWNAFSFFFTGVVATLRLRLRFPLSQVALLRYTLIQSLAKKM